MNKGNGTFETKYAIKLDMVDKKTGQDDERFSFLTFDMDGDGKMDLLAAKTDYGYHGGIFIQSIILIGRLEWNGCVLMVTIWCWIRQY